MIKKIKYLVAPNTYIKRGPPSQSLGHRQTPVYEDSGPQIMNHRVPYIWKLAISRLRTRNIYFDSISLVNGDFYIGFSF